MLTDKQHQIDQARAQQATTGGSGEEVEGNVMAGSVSGLGKGAGDVGGCFGVEDGRRRGGDMEMGGQVVSDETIASNEANGPGTKVNGIVPVVKMHKKTPGGWV